MLGTGKSLFTDGTPLARLILVDTHVLLTGVMVNTYRRSATDGIGLTARAEATSAAKPR